MSKHFRKLHAAAMHALHQDRRLAAAEEISSLIGKVGIGIADLDEEFLDALIAVATLTDRELDLILADIRQTDSDAEIEHLGLAAEHCRKELESGDGQTFRDYTKRVQFDDEVDAEDEQITLEEARRRKAVAEAELAELELARASMSPFTVNVDGNSFTLQVDEATRHGFERMLAGGAEASRGH